MTTPPFTALPLTKSSAILRLSGAFSAGKLTLAQVQAAVAQLDLTDPEDVLAGLGLLEPPPLGPPPSLKPPPTILHAPSSAPPPEGPSYKKVSLSSLAEQLTGIEPLSLDFDPQKLSLKKPSLKNQLHSYVASASGAQMESQSLAHSTLKTMQELGDLSAPQAQELTHALLGGVAPALVVAQAKHYATEAYFGGPYAEFTSKKTLFWVKADLANCPCCPAGASTAASITHFLALPPLAPAPPEAVFALLNQKPGMVLLTCAAHYASCPFPVAEQLQAFEQVLGSVSPVPPPLGPASGPPPGLKPLTLSPPSHPPLPPAACQKAPPPPPGPLNWKPGPLAAGPSYLQLESLSLTHEGRLELQFYAEPPLFEFLCLELGLADLLTGHPGLGGAQLTSVYAAEKHQLHGSITVTRFYLEGPADCCQAVKDAVLEALADYVKSQE
jgi:hypothetical protein